ncbi:syntaxin-43-like isoform X2 [Diospyros lotus]|uniref:syntaxin-43-like isoform X2 n=1 Tax=Diospyros lotus TaxID=55363 RepID=UPI00224DD97C|nr:syntaxin-43-like isoform X2 [Diospyros lotus]
MATRNRTLLYRKYRDALKSARAPLGSSTAGAVIELSSASLLHPNSSYAPLSTDDPGTTSSKDALTMGLPPAWVDVSEEITANVQRVRVKMAELAKTHAKALMPSFGDGKEDQRRIEALTQEVTILLKKSEKRLQRLSAGGPSEDSNLRKNVQGPDGIDLEMNLNGKNSRKVDDDLDDMGFNEYQMAKLRKNEVFTAQREREIQQVVESVNEVAQIMKDLSVLVIDQGTIVDRIDYNIQNVAASVEEGFKQLQKAERRQKQGGMVRCATVLIIMCFVMLVLLILKEILL